MDQANDAQRGIKRTAHDAGLNEGPKRIKALDQDVINKIAAGEIIVAPVHALKELLENAVDAGSTAVEVVVKEGGLKLLQISDNGHGINKEDLPILCERFTTSKLKTFDDLTSIGTYGFRGEALASISHIAHLSVTTKVRESSCAYRAYYSSGKLAPFKPGQSSDPFPTAGRPGTQITVEDLFYNIPMRRKAFRSPSEEYAKILDLIGRYAVHCTGVSFSCKKHGDTSLGVSIPTAATLNDRVRSIYGTSISTELLELGCFSKEYGFKASVLATSANYSSKKTTFLLFVNHRSVEALSIRKVLEAVYSQFLPKGSHPFVYISLEIDPSRVDVNVHPTKREVHFLNEDEIVSQICDALREKLAVVDTSRSFKVQTLIPGSVGWSPAEDHRTAKPLASKVNENRLVRTDHRTQKITSMLRPSLSTDSASGTETPVPTGGESRVYVKCKFTSIRNLRSRVKADFHEGLTESLSAHTFVGVVDTYRRIAAVQSGTKLLLVDYGMLSNALFYQIGLTDFGNFGVTTLSPSLSLNSLLEIGAEIEARRQPSGSKQIDWQDVVSKVHDQLVSRRDMLVEYFSMTLSANGDLQTIPQILKDYDPPLSKLPSFLLGLGPKVDWTSEQECFESFLRQLAEWYTPESIAEPDSIHEPPDKEDLESMKARRLHVMHAVEHSIFPLIKARLVATNDLLSGTREVADLKGLYRVFERC